MKILDVPQVGKLGLIVGQGGRFGQIRRTYVIPANPRTVDQMSTRRDLSQVASSWRSLTKDQQTAWITAASTVQSVRKGGTQGPLTGTQLYTKINCVNLLAGNPLVQAPPNKPDIGPAVATGLAITNTAGVVALSVTIATAAPSGNPYIVRASAPQSFGINAVPALSVLGVISPSAAGATDITALYNAKYGAPQAGQQVWVAVSATQEGWEDLPSTFVQVVPASGS
jgi:hypothetical protein